MLRLIVIRLFLFIIIFLLISSFGLPLIVDILLSLIFIIFFKLKINYLTFFSFLLFILIFIFNFVLNKSFEPKKNFYRSHEMFVTKDYNYEKNITNDIMMPHGDIISIDVCNNINHVAEPRRQIFKTDKYGYRNDRFDLINSDIILVGDSFIAGSSNTQKDLPSNVLSDLSGKNVYAITSISAPKYYFYHVQKNLNKIKKNSKIFIFYFEGNDFAYSYTKKKKDTIKNKISNTYLNLEKIKDKFFIETFNQTYKNNYFYKSIRPKSQRYYKKIINIWTNSCPVTIIKINNTDLAFYYPSVSNIKKVYSQLPVDKKIIKKISKVFFIPTKNTVYETLYRKKKYVPRAEFKFLKNEFNKINIDVEDLTPVLISASKKKLKNGNFTYYKDDTHWNSHGITAVMKHINKTLN